MPSATNPLQVAYAHLTRTLKEFLLVHTMDHIIRLDTKQTMLLNHMSTYSDAQVFTPLLMVDDTQ